MDYGVSRRDFLEATAFGIASLVTVGCSTDPVSGDGRLKSRPSPATGSVNVGQSTLGLASGRDGLLYVPANYQPTDPIPLVVLCHGAGGAAARVITKFTAPAEASQVVLLVPDSRDPTWDVISRGTFDVDVSFIDRALAAVFQRVAIDPARVTIAGFSDGASYALSLGLTNGDLFTRIAAFSPGFINHGPVHGKPPIWITHGTEDTILPIDRTSREMVPALRAAGYSVDYTEFTGPHTILESSAATGIGWLARPV